MSPCLVTGRRLYALLVMGLLSVLITLPHRAWAEFYPPRPIYDYAKFDPSSASCQDQLNPAFDHGRCGPTDGPVFDSFINTPSYGDERAFFDARRSDHTKLGSYENVLYDVSGGSQEVVLRIYVNNDANENFGYKTSAQNATVRVALPTNACSHLRAVAYISASNAAPQTVEDTVDLVDKKRFSVQFIRGSAEIFRQDGNQPLSDDIVDRGAAITNNGVSGFFEAGFDKDAQVQLHVRIVPMETRNHWVPPIAAALVIFGLLSVPPLRRQVVSAGRRCWEWQNEQNLGVQIMANLIAAGLTAAIVWLVTTYL
jgi:hypothetical protein